MLSHCILFKLLCYTVDGEYLQRFSGYSVIYSLTYTYIFTIYSYTMLVLPPVGDISNQKLRHKMLLPPGITLDYSICPLVTVPLVRDSTILHWMFHSCRLRLQIVCSCGAVELCWAHIKVLSIAPVWSIVFWFPSD